MGRYICAFGHGSFEAFTFGCDYDEIKGPFNFKSRAR